MKRVGCKQAFTSHNRRMQRQRSAGYSTGDKSPRLAERKWQTVGENKMLIKSDSSFFLSVNLPYTTLLRIFHL